MKIMKVPGILGKSIVLFLFLLPATVCFGFFGKSEEHASVRKYPLPRELTPNMQTELYGKMPVEYRARVIEKLCELQDSAASYWKDRKELYLLIQPHFENKYQRERDASNLDAEEVEDEILSIYLAILGAFKDYPEIFDPLREVEYWKESAQDLIELLEFRIDFLRRRQKQNAEERKRFEPTSGNVDVETLGDIRRDSWYLLHLPEWNEIARMDGLILPEKRQVRLAAGKPAYGNPFLDDASSSCFLSRQLETQGNTTTVRGRLTAPDLKALNLTAEDLSRWDGSTSLDTVAKTIAGHLCDAEVAPMSWNPALQPGIHDTEHTFELRPRTPYSETTKDRFWADYEELKANPIFSLMNGRGFSKTHGAIVNVIRGERDLSFSTRRPSSRELELAGEQGVELICTPFARDAFVFLVNRYNPVSELSSRQIRDMFSGKETSWKNVGGFGGSILPLGRNVDSGSEELMRELVMKDHVMAENRPVMIVQTMQGIFDALADHRNAIGYSVLYYERNMVTSVHSRTVRVDGVLADTETVESGAYPFTYECVLIHRKDPGPVVERFVQWMLGDEGQRVVAETGYVPIRTIEPEARNPASDR